MMFVGGRPGVRGSIPLAPTISKCKYCAGLSYTYEGWLYATKVCAGCLILTNSRETPVKRARFDLRSAHEVLMMFDDWKKTVRAIYDELHFGRDSIFGGGDGRNLARRLVTMIEERHPDYFVDASAQRIGKKEER